ncbi:MAG: hypothetical protein PHN80_16370 [Hespellia sp.]|nr:hypothetical protein [Hespellia sp.]
MSGIPGIKYIPIQETTPAIVVSSQDMDAANYKLLKFICNAGQKLVFGDNGEEKFAWEGHLTLHGSGKLLERAYRGETPKHFPWSGQKVIEYQKEFFDLELCRNFVYHYALQLEEWKGEYNQTDWLRETLKQSLDEEIQSNRIVATIYDPERFNGERDVPCWQWLQLRKLRGNQVRLECLYRSWDVAAIWANLAGIVKYMVDKVIFPAGGELVEVFITGTSTHVYRHDFEYARKVVGEDNTKRLR